MGLRVCFTTKCFYILSRLDNFYVSNYRKTRNLFLEYFQRCFSDFKSVSKKFQLLEILKILFKIITKNILRTCFTVILGSIFNI